MNATVSIRNLTLMGRIGTRREEQDSPQPLRVDASWILDAKEAISTDNIEVTTDYTKARMFITNIVESERFVLLERLTEEIARRMLLQFPRIESVTVMVAKLQARGFTEGSFPEVTITKQRPHP